MRVTLYRCNLTREREKVSGCLPPFPIHGDVRCAHVKELVRHH